MEKQKSQYPFLLHIVSIAAICVAGFLLIIKIIAFQMTGSLAILSGLMDSLLDIVASIINFFAVRYALNPADNEHRFGHGKAEALAGLMQSTLITTSVVLLMIESLSRFIDPQPVMRTDIGILVTIISIIVTGLLVFFQGYVVKKTGSLAIKADMMHYKTDFLLNAAILVSLFVIEFFDFIHIDTIISICIGLLILWGVKEIFAQSVNQILDRELPIKERKKLYQLAMSHPKVRDLHDLRTRTSGNGVFLQFHIELPPETLLFDAHNIAEEVEEYIIKNYDSEIEIFIHLDPHGHPRENPEDQLCNE